MGDSEKTVNLLQCFICTPFRNKKNMSISFGGGYRYPSSGELSVALNRIFLSTHLLMYFLGPFPYMQLGFATLLMTPELDLCRLTPSYKQGYNPSYK